MAAPPQRILIVQTARVGDLAFTAPAVAALATQNPGSRIDLVVNAPLAELAAEIEGVRGVLPLVKRGPGRLKSLAHILRVVKEGHYGWAICLTPSFRSAMVAFAAGAPETMGHAQALWPPWRSRPLPAAEPNLPRRFAAAITGNPADADHRPAFRVRRAPRQALPELPRQTLYAVVVPGASEPSKRRSAAWFAETAATLAREGLVVWVGSAVERPLAPDPLPHGHIAAFGLDWPDTLAVLAGARQVVGNDSGLPHVAAALGTPTVAVYGPTPEAQSASKCLTALAPAIACRPCYHRGPDRCRARRDFACLK